MIRYLSMALTLGRIQVDEGSKLFQGAVKYIVTVDDELTKGAELFPGLRHVRLGYVPTVILLNTDQSRNWLKPSKITHNRLFKRS